MGNIHSVIAPSSAGIWGSPNGCTGWVTMSQMYPETEQTPEAAEGEATHEVGSKLIKAASVSTSFIDLPVGMPASNGVIIDEEMYEGAEIYAEDVAEVMRKTYNFAPNIEQPIKAPSIHELSFGTPDCWLYDPKTGILYIWDYKFGYVIYEVFENWQLINYLSGILELLNLNGIATQHIKVHLRIVQPRAHHRDGIIREWVIMASDLRPYFNILEAKAHEALGSDSVVHTGKHCRYCSARHACKPAIQAGLQMYELAGQPLPLELSPDALGTQLTIVKRAIEQLGYIESGLDEQVKGLKRSGTLVPGWITEMGLGYEKWEKPIPEVIALGDMMQVDLRKPDNAITPKQARKKGIDDAVISAYSTTPQTGLKIVPDNGSKAKRMFNNGN